MQCQVGMVRFHGFNLYKYKNINNACMQVHTHARARYSQALSRGFGISETSTAASTPEVWILAFKDCFPLKGTWAPWRNGWFQSPSRKITRWTCNILMYQKVKKKKVLKKWWVHVQSTPTRTGIYWPNQERHEHQNNDNNKKKLKKIQIIESVKKNNDNRF